MKKNRKDGMAALVLLCAIFFGAASFFPMPVRAWERAAVLIAGAEGIAVFLMNSRAVGRSVQSFFIAFAGGMFMRLLLLGGFAFAAIRAGFPPALPLLSLVFLFLVLNLVQFPLFSTRR
jgi:hypothetical protein